jgi:hypothetical protein
MIECDHSCRRVTLLFYLLSVSPVCRFNPLADRCNIEYLRHEELYICRVPGCTWSGRTTKMAILHASRTHELRCHFLKRPTSEDRRRVEEWRVRYSTERQAGRSAPSEETEVRVCTYHDGLHHKHKRICPRVAIRARQHLPWQRLPRVERGVGRKCD